MAIDYWNSVERKINCYFINGTGSDNVPRMNDAVNTLYIVHQFIAIGSRGINFSKACED